MIITILGYNINSVNLAATLSLSFVIIKSWTNVKKHKLLFYFIDVYQIWGQPVLKKYSRLAAITILGYIINSVNPAATLSLCIDPFVKSYHAYGAIYMTG